MQKASTPSPIQAALCIDSDAFDRYGRVLRHLAVGLVDQAIALRPLSADTRVESLTLGPIQTLLHEPIEWPFRQRRLAQVVEALASRPPTVVHAMSHFSYSTAVAIADEFDIDVVLQVTSIADSAALSQISTGRAGRFLAFSESLKALVESQNPTLKDRVQLVRPGVQAAAEIACFADRQATPTVLCTSAFQKNTGVDRLIQALALLRQKGLTPLTFLLGRGRYESHLRRMVGERNLSSFVTFAQPLGDPTSAMRSADIFIEPGAGTEFMADGLEAMAMGVVVVATPGGVMDYVRADQTAAVAAGDTPEALAEVLADLLNNHDRARQLAGRAVEYVRTHHTMSAMAEATAAVYRNLALAHATFSLQE